MGGSASTFSKIGGGSCKSPHPTLQNTTLRMCQIPVGPDDQAINGYKPWSVKSSKFIIWFTTSQMLRLSQPEGRLNIKMQAYQYKDSLYKEIFIPVIGILIPQKKVFTLGRGPASSKTCYR